MSLPQNPPPTPPPLAGEGDQRRRDNPPPQAGEGRAGVRPTRIAVAVATVAVIAVVVVVVGPWGDIGDSGMSGAGWVAMLLGIVATLGLGIGLMALVFISNRRGYDDPGGPRA